MSFLDRIKNRLKQEEEPKELELTLEDIISRIDEKASNQDKEIIEKTCNQVDEIYKELSDFSRIISILEKIEPEGVPSGPKAVKSRFCTAASQQLNSVTKPKKDINEIRDFLNNTYTMIHNLGNLTQRQLMHIQFFFKEDFRPVSKKIKEISNQINESRDILRTRIKDEKVKELYGKLKELDRKIIEKGSKTGIIKKGVERLEKDIEDTKNNINKLDTTDYEKTNQEISALENKKSIIEQKITSFLSVEKLLKKLIHEKQVKDNLINVYIESPIKALLTDKDMKITSFIKQALELQEKGGIEVDEKKIEKANKIINTDYLKTNRKNLIEVMKELDKKKEYICNTAEPKLEKKKKQEEELNRLNLDLEKLQNNMKDLPNEIKTMENQKASLRNEIAQEASKIMNAIVRIK